MKKLVYSADGKSFAKDIKIFSDVEKLKPALSPICWSILKLLFKEELYPLQIAKRLGVHEQKVYYYIKKLYSAGLLEIARKREIKGALAKYFRTTYPSFGVELPFGERRLSGFSFARVEPNLKKFFLPFISKASFNGLVVVGSPDPHGPLKSWARDGHYAIYLALLLGNFIELGNRDFVKLDVEVKAEGRLKENMIVIGGPGVNVVALALNEHLPVRLVGEQKGRAPNAVFGKKVFSEKTKKTYKDETTGFIVKCANPFNKRAKIILLAGLGRRGTKAAVLGVTKEFKKVFTEDVGQVFTRVVRAVDLSGDGAPDSIEVLE